MKADSDVLLVDDNQADVKLTLRKVNGFEILNIVKADRKTQSIPVVMLTSSNQAQDVHECYRLGANSYIQNPVDYDEFCEAIQEIERYWLLFNQSRPFIRE